MGCWQYGGGKYWGSQDQQDVNETVALAIERGVNFFDTAEVYNDGDSERSLGIALKGKRDQVIIGTKVKPSNACPELLRLHCEQSLQRLQTDYIDLYMLHWPVERHAMAHFTTDEAVLAEPPALAEVFGMLQQLQKEGKIRQIGVSNHGINQMEEISQAGGSYIANELAYSLLSRAIEENILPYCKERNIGIIGYMPLQQGLLTGKYTFAEEVKPMQARSRHFHHSHGEGTRHGEEGAVEEVFRAIAQIRELANELGVHMISLSLAWAIANQGLSTILVGSRNREQLIQNLQAFSISLSPETVSELNSITKPVLDKLGNNPDYYEHRNNSRIR
nr:aldo/keto reductase [Paenibacillus montanisoli]